MWISAEVMRVLLLACLIGMGILGALSLRRRSLPAGEYLRWGLLLFVPLLGPFLVVLLRPGELKRR